MLSFKEIDALAESVTPPFVLPGMLKENQRIGFVNIPGFSSNLSGELHEVFNAAIKTCWNSWHKQAWTLTAKFLVDAGVNDAEVSRYLRTIVDKTPEEHAALMSIAEYPKLKAGLTPPPLKEVPAVIESEDDLCILAEEILTSFFKTMKNDVRSLMVNAGSYVVGENGNLRFFGAETYQCVGVSVKSRSEFLFHFRSEDAGVSPQHLVNLDLGGMIRVFGQSRAEDMIKASKEILESSERYAHARNVVDGKNLASIYAEKGLTFVGW